MKKKLALALAVMLLLAACTPWEVPPLSATDTQTPTAEASATTAPTEPELPAWYAQETAAHITYEELTTKDLPYSGGKWLISGEQGAAIFEIQVNAGKLEVRDVNSFGEAAHTIALPEELSAAIALGSNGRIGYVATDTKIAAIDLQTGEAQILAEADRLLDAAMVSYDVIYYGNEAEGKATICRLYLPDMVTDTIYGDIPVYPASAFRLIPPATTLGKVGWTMMNPEIMEILEKEYANPDSVYKNTGAKFDFSDVWGQPGMIDTGWENNPLALSICQVIQEKSGILALVRCWYEPVTREYTQELGAIDDCFTGTGLWHDHYDPKAEAPAVPKVEFSPWQDVGAAPLIQTREELLEETADKDAYTGLLYADPYAFPILYAANPGEPLTQVLAEPVTRWENSRYYIYAVTRDGKLMQLSLDGSVRNLLYKARFGELRDVDYQCGMVYVLDGDHLVQIDLVNMQLRDLLKAEGMVDCRYYGEDQVFICQSRGLHQRQYILDLKTKTLAEAAPNEAN